MIFLEAAGTGLVVLYRVVAADVVVEIVFAKGVLLLLKVASEVVLGLPVQLCPSELRLVFREMGSPTRMDSGS